MYVTTTLPQPIFGAIFHPEFRIRPNFDQHCPGNVSGIVADVAIYDGEDNLKALSTEDGIAVLKQIRREQPSVWLEIEAAANSKFAA